MKRSVALPVVAVALTTLVGSLPRPAAGQACKGEGAQVGRWKTWVLSSGSEIPVPAPPAENSDQTKAELAELRLLQSFRSPNIDKAARFWNDVPVTHRWTEVALALSPKYRIPGPLTNRLHGILGTAMYDAVVAAWNAKYAYNRRPPYVVAPDLTTDVPRSTEPSYPSEHAAVAGAAAAVLSYLFPDDAKSLAAMAQEAGEARLLAGANYRSDMEAGLALGAAVGAKAVARAKADGFDTKFTGTLPTGPGIWTPPPGVEPIGLTAAAWKPWILTSSSQLRPGPPPALDSARFKADLAEVKRINASVTPTERAVAVWWGTMSAGVWQRLAHDLIVRDRLSTPCAARVIGFLDAALADSGIAGLEAKYAYWLFRPFQADPSIMPLIGAPAFPSYPAGAGVTWGTAGEVLAYYFPQDAARIHYMENEALISRIYAGIHYRFDLEVGLDVAKRLTELTIQRDAMNEN